MLTLTLAELELLARDQNPALAALLAQLRNVDWKYTAVRVDPALLNPKG